MTTTAKPPANFTEVTDKRGRVYRVGESDRDILGHSRALMVVLPWVAMMAISVFEYAYGVRRGHAFHGTRLDQQ